MKWIYHEREARVIYSPTHYRQPVIYWATGNLLARFYFDSYSQETMKGKRVLQMFPVIKRIPAKNFDCNRVIYMYFVSL